MRMYLFAGLVALAPGFLSSAAKATPLVLTNPSFETDTQGDGGANTTSPTGWSYTDSSIAFGAGSYDPSNSAFNGSTGNTGTDSIPGGTGHQIVYFSDSGSEAGIFQNSSSIALNTQYDLTVAIGNRADLIDDTVAIRLFAQSGSTLTFIAEALADPETYSLPGTFVDLTVSSSTAVTNLLIGQNLQVQLINTNTLLTTSPVDGFQVVFDNVRLESTPVPEPAFLSLMAIGGVALLFRRRTVNVARV